jgi:hypothetical protein
VDPAARDYAEQLISEMKEGEGHDPSLTMVVERAGTVLFTLQEYGAFHFTRIMATGETALAMLIAMHRAASQVVAFLQRNCCCCCGLLARRLTAR